MRPRSILFIIVSALIAVAPAGAQAAQLLGPADGVTATRTRDTVDVRFTPAALAAAHLKAGQDVEAECSVQPLPPALAFLDDSAGDDGSFGRAAVGADGVAHLALSAGSTSGVPRPVGTVDGCTVERFKAAGANAEVAVPVARVALTPNGDAWLDESASADALVALLQRAHGAAGYQPAAALGAGVVALASADATPTAAGELGYWTDGTRATVAALGATGSRFVIEDLGDGLLRTNLSTRITLDEGDDLPDAFDALTDTPKDQDKADPRYRGPGAQQPGDGVRAAVHGRRLVVRFTGRSASAFRAIAGRRVAATCFARPAASVFPQLTSTPGKSSGVGRVPRDGGRVAITLSGHAQADACLISDDGAAVAVAAPTDAGLRWTRDVRAVNRLGALDAAISRIGAPGGQAYRPTADAVQRLGKQAVAMAGPDGPAPTGRVGVWTDGARRAVIATRSASGRVITLADEGDRTIATNLVGELNTLWLVLSFAGSTSGGGVGTL